MSAGDKFALALYYIICRHIHDEWMKDSIKRRTTGESKRAYRKITEIKPWCHSGEAEWYEYWFSDV